MIIDEIISYTEHKKIVNKKGGKIAKHAKGTTIWTIALYDKEGIRTVKAVVKKGEQTRKQFEENLEIMPKVKYVFSDSAISLRSSSKPKVSEAGLQPKKVSTCRRIFAREI